MTVAITTLHIIVCIALILIVLLQTGKGAGIGSAFGSGSSQTVFGSSGPASFLARFTTVAAVIFMLTSLSLSYFSGGRLSKSIMPETSHETETQPLAPADDSGEKEADKTQNNPSP